MDKPPSAAQRGNTEDYGWTDIANMTQEEIKQELTEQRHRYETMERDLFKAQTAARKAEAQLKTLKDLQTIHGATHNNTSSAFTLPSEFKTLWDELVTELILDALPDFLSEYKYIVPLI